MEAERHPSKPKPAPQPKEEPAFDIGRIRPGMKPEVAREAELAIIAALKSRDGDAAQGTAPEPFQLEAIRPGMKTEDIRRAELAILRALKDGGM
jgi:hypothetical protein